MPPPLSRYLKHLHFFAFCRLHRINPLPDANSMDSVDRSLLKIFRHLRDYKPANDLNAFKENPKWINFAGAVHRCETLGFTDKTVEKLVQTVRDLGGGKVAWTAEFSMDARGNLVGRMGM